MRPLDMTKTEKPKLFRRSDVLQGYIQSSTVAGISIWANKNKRFYFRFIVFILWLVLLGSCCALLVTTLRSFFRYDVSVAIHNVMRSETQLPGVTICPNHGGTMKSKVGGSPWFVQQESLGKYENWNQVINEPTFGLGLYFKLLLDKSSTILQIQRTCLDQNMTKLIDSYEDFNHVLRKFNGSLAATVSTAFPPFESIFLECGIGHEDIPCERLFFGRTSVTSSGLCYTFNFNGTVRQGPGTFIFTYGDGKEYLENLRKVKSDGQMNGLRIRLHAREKDFCMSYLPPFQGFKVAIHDVNQLPANIDNIATMVSPGFRTQIVSRELLIDRTRVEDLGECSTEKQLHLFDRAPYSHENCVTECLAEIIWMILLAYGRDRGFRNCSSPENCPPPCIENFYDFRSSATRYPPTNMLPNLLEATGIASEEEYLANVAELDIFLSTLYVETMKIDWAMTPSALFNSLGGSLGLFLGISMFSIVELGLFALALMCKLQTDK